MRQDVPELLDSVFQRMLAKDPRDRYQDTRDLVVDLEMI